MSVLGTSKHSRVEYLTVDEDIGDFYVVKNKFPKFENKKVILSSVERDDKGSFVTKKKAIEHAQSLSKLHGTPFVRGNSVLTAVFAIDRYYIFQLSNPDHVSVKTELLGSGDTLQKASDKAREIARARNIEFISPSNEVAAEMKEAAI